MWSRKKPAAPRSDSPRPLREECAAIEGFREVAADWTREVTAEEAGRA